MDRQGYLNPALVAKVCGVPIRTLNRWTLAGLTPCELDDRRRGGRPLYSWRDTLRVMAVARLREAGLTTRTIKRAVAVLTERLGVEDGLLTGRLVVANGQPFWVEDDAALVNLLVGQRAWRELVLLQLDELTRQVELALAA